MDYKKDPALGFAVEQYLVDLGVETPTTRREKIDPGPQQTEKNIAKHFEAIMRELGLDTKDDSLRDTPQRVAKMFYKELFWGLDYANFPKMTVNPNDFDYTNMLIEVNIPVKSMCEHHFIPIKGVAHVAYIPSDRVIGLSKLNRLVHFFSRRPQVQERLNKQIIAALRYILDTEDVAAMISAEHLCVSHRGVQDHGTITTTTELSGAFMAAPVVRQEFLQSITITGR